MQLLGGFSPVNAIKQVGSVINPTGGVANYDVFTNLGNQRSTSTAQSSYDPNMGATFYNTATGQLEGPNLPTAQQPAPQNTGAYSGSGSGISSATKQQNIDFVNRAFDAKRAGLQSQLNVLAPQEQAAQLRVSNQYTNQNNALKTGLATGQRNLNLAQNQVNTARERSLKNLRDAMAQQAMSYSNQLGAYGAGDSSAAGLINVALGQQSSRNRGDVLQNASQQTQAIQLQGQDLEREYQTNLSALNDWKQSTLADLTTQFAQQKNAIMNEMANADLARQQQLAQYDAALTQSAIDRLSQIESMYTQQGQDLVSRFQNIFAPQDIRIADNLQQFQVAPISEGQLAGLRLPGAVNPEDPAVALLRRREDENLPLSV